jgi:tricorn protease
MRLPFCLALSAALGSLLAAVPAAAQIDARMLRQPDVSASQIAFVYAGDIWVAPKQGGVAVRLSSPRGEESFPRFSPDGKTLAYSANYDGNTDVYTVPAHGGDPSRLTWHPMSDRVLDWHPDGTRVLFTSSRESGRQRYGQFYLVAATGGPAEKLPVPYGEFATFSPDARQLAYLPQSQAFRTWKRYRGGWAADVWTFDLATKAAANITASDANDESPMWHGDTLYFLSDRGANQRANIWARDKAGAVRQVTQFADFDVTFPALGPQDIVFEAGGRLYLLNLATEKTSEVAIQVITDRTTLKPRAESVAELIREAAPSPTGKRAVFQARGDVFTVPAEHGPVLNLTRSSGSAERYPRWSPDGKTLAYWSDRSGEYELVLRPADGTGTEKTVTTLGPGYRYPVQWSPDSNRLAFLDQAEKLRLLEVASGKLTEVDQAPIWMAHDQLENLPLRWSADSRWLTWSRGVKETANPAIFLFDTTTAKKHQVTPGYFADVSPVFDPGGKYLYFLSNRSFEPVYGDFDNSWTYPNSTRIVAAALRRDVLSPLAARNDAEGDAKADKDKGEASKDDEDEAGDKKDGDTAKAADTKDAKTDDKTATKDAEKKGGDATKDAPKPVAIDVEGLDARVVALPPKAGNYNSLAAIAGKVLYRRLPRTGSGEEKASIVYYDLDEREEKTVFEGADAFIPTADGKKLFVLADKKYGFVEVKAAQKIEKALRTAELETTIDPKAEWNQMFADAFRFQRDFFYDPGLHGVEWPALRARYQALMDAAVTRWDVNFVLGDFMGELNASHTYRGGGDVEKPAQRGVGLLGVDWALENGAYRIAHIAEGASWDADARSPLRDPGVNVKEGDYVLAVNGVPLRTDQDPLAAFQGLADKTVLLTVNGTPSTTGARQVTVRCLGDDTQMRYREWIEARRAHVDKATNGRVGYIYVQSTGVDAQNELMRQFMAQWRKDALIIDERFNSGGQIPDRFIELLNRPMLAYWAVRQGEDWQWPPIAHRGPKVMLINGWSGSGGDAFPFYFREAKLGPLVGTRTWGGLIGLSGSPELVDGGGFTVPTFRMYDVRGNWFAEGVGVEPDIKVDENPTELAKGIDPQLERAIAEAMTQLKTAPPAPARPKYERRVPPATPGAAPTAASALRE